MWIPTNCETCNNTCNWANGLKIFAFVHRYSSSDKKPSKNIPRCNTVKITCIFYDRDTLQDLACIKHRKERWRLYGRARNIIRFTVRALLSACYSLWESAVWPRRPNKRSGKFVCVLRRIRCKRKKIASATVTFSNIPLWKTNVDEWVQYTEKHYYQSPTSRTILAIWVVCSGNKNCSNFTRHIEILMHLRPILRTILISKTNFRNKRIRKLYCTVHLFQLLSHFIHEVNSFRILVPSGTGRTARHCYFSFFHYGNHLRKILGP